MDSKPPPPHPLLADEILPAIRRELEPYGPAAATIDFAWSSGFEGWRITVTPSRLDAAPLDIGIDIFGGLSLAVANSSMYESADQFSASELATIARNVFAGRIEEIGMKHNAYIRIGEGQERQSFGAMTVPIPRRLRRVRRFSAYGDA